MANDEDVKLPENLDRLIQDIGLFIADGTPEDQLEVMRRGAEGYCMTCASPLGPNTLVVLNTEGVLMLFCGGACMTDMQVAGWLEELYDDLKSRIAFRGGRGDEVS